MKTKILYVLVSTIEDIFAEQTFLSILSLRKHNAHPYVSLLMDNKTAESLKERKFDLLGIVDEPIVIYLPDDMSNKFKSRVLKTSMRKHIEGDYLYIDSDTIILADLSDIDNEKSSLAAVYEYNRSFHKNTNKKTLAEIYNRLGYNINQITEYFNSGVMYVKDNKETKAFFDEWNEEWHKCTEKGVLFDQPSLGVVNARNGQFVSALDGSWNCQGRYCLNYAHDVKIYHYLFDKGYDFPLMKKEAFYTLKEDGSLNADLETALTDPLKCVGSINLIITGDDVVIRGSRLYAFVKSIYGRKWLFSSIERVLSGFYSIVVKLKKRNLAPPR